MAGNKLSKEDPINHPNHYNINKDGEKAIETFSYIRSWKMDYPESNIVKYVTRWKDKNGIEDLKKAKQYLDKLIDLQTLKND